MTRPKNGLVPVKRMDRNGRMVTRHVRPDAGSGKKLVIPAPDLATAWSAPTKAQQLMSSHSHIRGQFNPQAELRALTERKTGDITFRASEEQMYEVLAVTSPGNALLLLDDGVRTMDGALAYLHHDKLGHLAVDNERLCMEAMKRRIPAASFMQSLRRWDPNSPYFMDAAEASGIEGMELENVVPTAVYEGRLSIEDIRTVGSHRFKRHSGWSGRIGGRQLIKIAEGNGGKSTPESLGIMMDKFGDSPTVLSNAITLDERYGSPLTSKLRWLYKSMMDIEKELQKSGASDDETIWALIFASEVKVHSGSLKPVEMTASLIKRFREANIDAKDVGSGKITVSHLEAIESGNLKSTVAEGWL